ncbi:TPA: hypothetical protein ACOEPF_000623 [Stenotrophomonas maltophilia]|jgi:hypothetical protein|uniref:hypothetical protein n=1 Tax=Stenotrophomonas TaxID=40323 RepID=UPI00244D56D7|nr:MULTISPECIES: hypothetical protein [Stenotrophomonas]MBN5024713.1 hypothetical protein [Stenotrophomonas maltophilia]MDH1483649.1 hypothetical protein [Stenotrophomonas sp. GD03712]WON69589.1 hypothetical protein RWT08_04380 [Stenotrophomonas maltophilia]HDS1101070.1 hypothetical protein [Stenotrophomonas maltophilia]HDS1107102.1 hypothetical protein [Stenotrophomonas maltophilia]
MNRRGFLRALGAVPVIAAVPAVVARLAPVAAAAPATADSFKVLAPEVGDGATTIRNAGGRTEFRDGRFDVYDERGVLRISMGCL